MLVSERAELIKVVTRLKKNTEYEFQVLAFTSVGDGPKSSVVVERTNEDGKWKLKSIYASMFNWTRLLKKINKKSHHGELEHSLLLRIQMNFNMFRNLHYVCKQLKSVRSL